jgi:low affinity Fe/Cu permease
MVEDGRKIIQDLIEEGYSRDEIEFSLAWVADNVDKVHSIKIIPKILAQALADRESKKLKEERELLLKEKKQNEKKEIEVEEKQQRELEKEFKKLNKQEQEKITKKARENLIKQGTKPEFIIEPVLKIERDKILLKRSQKTLVEN